MIFKLVTMLHWIAVFIDFKGNASSSEKVSSKNNHILPVRVLTNEEIIKSEQAGYSYAKRLAQIEEELHAKGQYVKGDSPFAKMASYKRPKPEARKLCQQSFHMLEATRYLHTNNIIRQSTADLTIIANNSCLPMKKCPSISKYRTIDGSCNNLAIPNLGKSFTVYRRLIPPVYADGLHAPRVSSNGSDLTGARIISLIVFDELDIPMSKVTLSLMQFGQFINHDLQSTGQVTFVNGTDINCCTNDGGTLDPSQLHPACLPISVPIDDEFMNVNKTTITTCMNFVRSTIGPRLNCSLGYADQLNQNTHWLDASTIYGSTYTTLASLRVFTGGLLKTTNDAKNKRTLLPVSSPCTKKPCFYSGDSRATEQPQLTIMHTLWMREHNRIAKELSALNPSWNDRTIFQEARRIVIAELQHITFNEFIPTLLSPATVSKYGLAPLTSDYFTGFISGKTGPISNEFSTAAFRFGHSLVQESVNLYNEKGQLLNNSYIMSNTFDNSSMITQDSTFLDAVIRGLLTQPSQSVDPNVDDALWNSMFRDPSKHIGFDVVSLNIQRGRDHGLPSYNTYRQWCGFNKVSSFAELNVTSTTNPVIPTEIVELLESTHNSVDDIDVYVGGLAELPAKGSLTGPTFNCLIGENFKQIKYNDRYFYEIGNKRHSFNLAQLDEIRKASLARIFCDNSDGTVLRVQRNAFKVVSAKNPKILCSNSKIPRLNLSLWQAEQLF